VPGSRPLEAACGVLISLLRQLGGSCRSISGMLERLGRTLSLLG
jgi:hypothetical protein